MWLCGILIYVILLYTPALPMCSYIIPNPIIMHTCTACMFFHSSYMADAICSLLCLHFTLLAGYAVLLRHPKDEVNYCVYIIPGNPKLSNDDLSYWHHYMLEKDPNVSRAVGKAAKLERMKAGSLRIGGEPITYGKHVLLIGDAAGFVDPMTGEGIHTALDSGRIAAHFLCEAIAVGNFDKEVMKEYQNRWLKAFGMDFKW